MEQKKVKETKGWLNKYGKENNANDSSVSIPNNFVGEGYSNIGRNYSPAWGGQFQEGGLIQQRIGAPSNGKYAKKTLPSAQNGNKLVVDSWNKVQEDIKKEKAAKLKTLDTNFVKELINNSKNKKIQLKENLPTKYFDNTKVNLNNKPELISKTARNKTDKEIAYNRQAKIDDSIKAQDNDFTTNNWREQLARETQSIGDKLRVSLEPNFFDDYINPAAMIGSMASNLGQAPLQAEQQDSYLPYLTSIGTPLATGALAGFETQNTGQFVNNLVNPIAGIKNPLKNKNISALEEVFDVPKDFLTKLKNKQEAMKSIDFVKNDLIDPETIKRAVDLGINPEIFEQATKNLTYTTDPTKSYYSPSDLQININPNQIGGTKEQVVMSGIMGSKHPNYTSNEIGSHETGHFFQDRAYWSDLSKGTSGVHPTKIDEMLGNLETKNNLTGYHGQGNKSYFTIPTERFPMFREYRQGMRDSGILKNKWDDITPEHIKDFRKLKPENRLNSFMEFNDKNYKLLNEVSKIAPVVLPIGLGTASQLEQKKDGGIIKDDRGQWDFPNEITRIEGGNITMQPDPLTGKPLTQSLIGISDKGEKQIMHPNKNYKFKNAKFVIEYPIGKNGINNKDSKTKEHLDQLTNFTLNNKPNWLSKYK